MTIEVILLEKIKGVGEKGDIVSVKEGYARNYLMPLNLAQLATSKAKEAALAVRAKREEEQREAEDKLKETAKKLAGLEITLKEKAEDGKLFGSPKASDLIAAIEKERGVRLEKGQLKIKGAIKEIGEYEILVKLSPVVMEKIKLKIEGEEK